MRISGVERYISDIYLMFLSREIDIKLCQIYMKIQIYAILYKSCSIKQIIFIPQKLNQSELKTLEWWISRYPGFTKPKIILKRIQYPRKKLKI